MMRRVVVADKGGEIRQFVQAIDIANRAIVNDAVPRSRIDGVVSAVALTVFF